VFSTLELTFCNTQPRARYFTFVLDHRRQTTETTFNFVKRYTDDDVFLDYKDLGESRGLVFAPMVLFL